MNSKVTKKTSSHNTIAAKLSEFGITLFGVADLSGLTTLLDQTGRSFSRAVSFARRMDPAIMSSIKEGPNQVYAVEYARANNNIKAAAAALVSEIQKLGFEALTFGASERTDPINIRGDFPHKTAATRAGIGWIGRNCQLITRKYGPWIRLGTVFTHMPLDCAEPLTKNHCGKCMQCVEACPADALIGNRWKSGMQRCQILDAARCDRWKKENYFQFHKGHNCGICAAVCPFGR